MAKTVVYRSFEVRDGFGPAETGPVVFRSEARAEADAFLEARSGGGVTCQLFGVRAEGEGEAVRLRALLGRLAA